MRMFVTAKIHRATVTGADLRSRGSIGICPELMQAAGLAPYEFVHVNSFANGHHWETFVIPGLPGQITLHGPPTHHFHVGDRVVINRIEIVTPEELPFLEHRCVEATDDNKVLRVFTSPIGSF